MAFPEVETLTDLVRPLADARGLDIETVKTVKAGKKSQVVIAVSGDEAPTLDQLEEVSNAISELFDAAEDRGDVDFGAGYTLEVTTPGVDLPLTQPRHWRRNRGRLVSAGGQVFRLGALDAAEENIVLITPSAKKSEAPSVRVAPISELSGAVVEIEFNSPSEAELELAERDFEDAAALSAGSQPDAPNDSTTRKDDK